MSIIDYSFQQAYNSLVSLQNTKIKVSTDFHGRMAQINKVLDCDHTALISTILDFQVHASCVPITFDTDNNNLTSLFEKWQKELNKNIAIDIPSGLRSLSEQYHRERLTSSFIVLNIKWAKLDGYWLPERMWFVDGASVYVKKSSENLTSTKYYIGEPKNKDRNLIPRKGTDTIIRKPYNQWNKPYPVPYLAKRGALYHAIFKQKILEKQAIVVESIIPYLSWIKIGSEEAMRRSLMPGPDEIAEKSKQFKDAINDSNNSVKPGQVLGAFPFDVNFENIIPDLSKILNADLTKTVDKNLLAALGLIELEGFSKSREETILNPKVLVEEVTDSVLDYVELLETVVSLIKEKNSGSHRKSMGNDIRIVPGTIKAFITNDMKILYRSLHDRGVISRKSSVEDTTGLDFKVEVARLKKERKEGLDKTCYPPSIINQKKWGNDPSLEDPEKVKEESPEKKKTEKDIESSFEEIDIITEPMKSVNDIPLPIRGELNKEQAKKFLVTFNEIFEQCTELQMDAGLRDVTSLKLAYEAAKKELVVTPYTKIAIKGKKGKKKLKKKK